MRSGNPQASLDEHLPSAAQEALDALRVTFDERVNALEAALSDPQQAGSLNALVLELARVATDEADAAARQACLQAHLDAERSAAGTIAQDRQTIASLRQALEGARSDINGARAEAERERQLGAAAQREAQDAAQRALAADEGRRREAEARTDAVDTRMAQLAARAQEAESRAAAADSRTADAQEQIRELEQERGELVGVQRQLTVQLDKAKAASADLTAALAAWKEQAMRAEYDLQVSAREQQAARQRAEKSLHDTSAALAAATAARDAALVERDDATTAHAALAGERDRLRAERDAARMARETACRERDDARSVQDSVRSELDAACAAREAADAARDALAAEFAALKQTLVAQALEATSQRAGTTADRQRVDEAAREAAGRIQLLTQEREHLASRLQTLQDAVKTRDQDWTTKLRALEQKLRAAEEAARAHAAPPGSAAPAAARAAAPRAVAPASLPEPPPEPPSVAEAVAAIQDAAGTAADGVFSTVADALRAWSTEPGSEHLAPRAAAAPSLSADLKNREPAPQTFESARRAKRYNLAERDVRVQIDGETARIVDLSDNGAQIVTSVMLKPGRYLKITFPGVAIAAPAKGRIIWSRLEPPTAGHGVLTYRAGVAFTSIDPQTIRQLVGDTA